MNSWFLTSQTLPRLELPGSDVRFSEELVERLLRSFTKKGEKILDPFAGFGTTLVVAQRLGRVGVGVEFDERRVEYVRKLLVPPSQIMHGDSRKLSSFTLPRCDASLTSPPYMRSFDEENAFSKYEKPGNYARYLREIKAIYAHVAKTVKKDGVILVEVSNTFGKGHPMTPLAWDVGKALCEILFLERELINCAKSPPANGANHSHVLVFRNRAPYVGG